MQNEPAAELGSALARWPNVERLAADCDDDSAAVISAAPLSKLKALVLERTLTLEALRGCSQLRKLSLKGCYVSDLGPLAGCDQLEELSTCI
ncbi:hypothetical protein FOA52_015136 [Chlamydomonas sp. UWO 241]|nr:hypothetical protein FOA52_015136 [Chlamydomonas sp. UWO 241]